MNRVIIRVDTCKGCGLCMTACPQKILRLATDKLNAKGYHPAEVTDMTKCKGCALCALMCPDVAIKVEKEVED